MTAKELKKVIGAHKKWLDGEGREGRRADFSNADLHGVNLRRADLQGADLRGANLRGVDLRNANLRSSEMWNADLRGANLQHADLQYADLHGVKLQRADLQDADLRNVNLRGADLRNADLRGANLQHADLQYADLHGVKLRGADLQGADLRNADLRGADIDFSCLPLWCGSLEVKIDAKIAAQLMYHIMRAMQSVKGDADVKAVLANEDNIRLANRFHRAAECGEIEKWKGTENRVAKKNGAGKPKERAKT